VCYVMLSVVRLNVVMLSVAMLSVFILIFFILSFFMLSFVLLDVVMVSVFMLSFVLLNITMLNVLSDAKYLTFYKLVQLITVNIFFWGSEMVQLNKRESKFIPNIKICLARGSKATKFSLCRLSFELGICDIVCGQYISFVNETVHYET
jgi:hypothetical protein